MKKTLKILALLGFVAATLSVVACAGVDADLVGEWDFKSYSSGSYDYSDGDADVTFTSSDVTYYNVTYKCTASGGEGQFWVDGVPSVKWDFTYVVDGDTLALDWMSLSTYNYIKL